MRIWHSALFPFNLLSNSFQFPANISPVFKQSSSKFSFNHPTLQPPNPSTTQPLNPPTPQPPNPSTTQPINQPTFQPPNFSTTQLFNHPTPQPTNQSTTQTTPQSTNLSTTQTSTSPSTTQSFSHRSNHPPLQSPTLFASTPQPFHSPFLFYLLNFIFYIFCFGRILF